MFRTLSPKAFPAKSKVLVCYLTIGGLLLPAPRINAQELVSAAKPVHSNYLSHKASKQGKALKTILSELENQYGVRFVYESSLVDRKQLTYSGASEGKTLEEMLDEVLSPAKLTYQKLDARTYGIVRKQQKSSKPQAHTTGEAVTSGTDLPLEQFSSANTSEKDVQNQQAAIAITGKVTDSNGEVVVGANVLLKGTTSGTTTNADGNYTINVPDDQANGTLVFSFIGYLTEEVPINNRTTVDVSLVPDVQSLNEVVVTALGIKREQKALGYAVSTISSEQITQAGNTNFASALYGKAAGVKITTAPGGATSAANIQIRGINSLNGNTQPLYVVDGILIRNNTSPGGGLTTSGLNNGGYWDDTRIRGNGILDVNPADIESINVLKGASASALYGSEAANGVIVITTKKGSKRQGLGVDVNYVFNTEQVAFTPNYQNIYGPGYDRETNLANGATEDGWIPVDLDGDGVMESQRPYFRAYAQFGPRMEGQEVPWWDGTTRKYSPQPNNYKDFYQRGYNSNFNVSLSNQTDRAAYRFSYNRLDYQGIQRGGNMQRNSFNLNSNIKLHDKVSTDIVINYVNSKVHNRPEQINRIAANYGGFFSRADYMDAYLDKYQTSEGYKYVLFNQTDRNPDEAIKYNIRANDLLEFLWRQNRNSEDEFQDRVISSVTLNYQILKNLSLRGRIGNDFTSLATETKQYNEYPVAFNSGNSTGSYGIANGRYSILYGDALLTYTQALSPSFNLSATGGVQGRRETYRDHSNSTNGGLVVENWFNLKNSYNGVLNFNVARRELLKYALLGTLNLSYKDLLFVEGTARQEYSSTLPAGSNSYFYPSVNAGFVFTDAFQLPAFLSYGKLRAAYGIVGNAPGIYAGNVVYEQNTLVQPSGGSIVYQNAPNIYGNNSIQPEQKHEIEFGLDTRVFQNKLGVDLTYYNSRVEGQILDLDLPTSVGASKQPQNIGVLRSYGWELALNATPVKTNSFQWDSRFNFAVNRTKVEELIPGLEGGLNYYQADGGAVMVKAEVGRLLGDVYVHPRQQDANGNYVIDEDGYYVMSTEYKRVGNILPKAIGGFSNTVAYKGFALDFTIDYRIGGKLISTPLLYGKGAGMYEETLEHRDAEHGGLPYYIDADNNKVALPDHNSQAPDGSKVYHDGVLLSGVTTDGEPNTTLLDAASYYVNTFTWSTGWYENGAVFDNSYIKMREAVLSYNLPKQLVQKLRLQNVQLSLIGRNLFYFWKTLPHLDPEVSVGTHWSRQGVDEGSSAATRSYGVSLRASF